MLDTVAVKFPVSLTSIQLDEWVSHPLILPNGKKKPKYFQNTVMGGVIPINFTYYPPNPRYPDPHFRIGVSLPRVLFGDNVQLIEEQSQIDEAIYLVNQFLPTIPWIPKVDFGAGTLFRVDATYNHPVGDRAYDYIKALFNLDGDYPQRDTRPWKYSGVQFYSKATTTTFYDLLKKHQTLSASGLLRQETSMRESRNIEERMGKGSPTLRDVTIGWLADTLDKDLKVLHLDNAIICSRDLALEILLNKYGVYKGTRLYGYLITRQSMSRKQLISKGAKDNALWERDNALHDAGVALTMTEKVSLPPLSIV